MVAAAVMLGYAQRSNDKDLKVSGSELTLKQWQKQDDSAFFRACQSILTMLALEEDLRRSLYDAEGRYIPRAARPA